MNCTDRDVAYPRPDRKGGRWGAYARSLIRRRRTARQRRCRERRGFTLVELLVVMIIIVILIGAVVAAGTTLINKARTSNTRALLTIVRDAVEQFEREQKATPTLTRKQAYTNRYGYFPPDELEVFTPSGIPNGPPGSLAVGGAEIVPAPDYPPMQFYTRGLPPDEAALEHRDLAAMIVAIETLGDASTAILDGIPERNRSPGPLDANRDPVQFLDHDGDGSWDSEEDFQIRYILDDWGIPIRYFAQRDWNSLNPPPVSSNHADWNEASSEFIRLNGGQPVIMSYGPNGKDQLTQDAMGSTVDASLVGDFEQAGPSTHRINHPMNADNVYADQTLKDKLAEGI